MIKDVDINTVSGEVKLKGISTGNMQLNGVSGKIDAKDMKTDTVDISTTSGEIDFSGNADDLKGNSISGGINISGIYENVETGNTSGEIVFNGSADGVDLSTVSGGIKASFTASPEDISISSTSGSEQVYLPDDISGFTVNVSSVSAILIVILPCYINQASRSKAKALVDFTAMGLHRLYYPQYQEG